MSELSRRIQDHTPSRPPILDSHDHVRVEAGLLTYEQARYETAARLRIENELLREQGQRLAADNVALAVRIEDLTTEIDALWAENARLRATETTMSQAIERLGARALRDRERLIVAEQAHTVWLAGLAVVTLATVIVAISIIR